MSLNSSTPNGFPNIYPLPTIPFDSRRRLTVIPAEAGIQSFQSRWTRDWTPAPVQARGRLFAGVTDGQSAILPAKPVRNGNWEIKQYTRV
jgi:hypothetical protein